MLVNTHLNSKKPEAMTTSAKKTHKKKVTWDEKLVNRPHNTNMSSTLNKFR